MKHQWEKIPPSWEQKSKCRTCGAIKRSEAKGHVVYLVSGSDAFITKAPKCISKSEYNRKEVQQ